MTTCTDSRNKREGKYAGRRAILCNTRCGTIRISKMLHWRTGNDVYKHSLASKMNQWNTCVCSAL